MFVGCTFPNTTFAETGLQEQCVAGISHSEFWSVSALCRLQSASSSLLPVAVLADSLARFCGPFSSQSAPLPEGFEYRFLRYSVSLFRVGHTGNPSSLGLTPQFSRATSLYKRLFLFFSSGNFAELV